jgi:predicted dehydrogenase
MKEFARSIQADTEPPITPEQGRKVVEILELIDEQ